MERRRRTDVVLWVLAIVAVVHPLAAHDLQTRVELHPPFVVLHASYEGEEPASFLSVTVHPPAGAAIKADAFQTGRTDFAGRFVFQPTVPGDWRLVVDDEMGHRVEQVAAVSSTAAGSGSGAASGSPTVSNEGRSSAERLLIGLSLLFGASGLLYGWTARKRVRRAS